MLSLRLRNSLKGIRIFKILGRNERNLVYDEINLVYDD